MIEKINRITTTLRLGNVDIPALLQNKTNLTPLESIVLYLETLQNLRIEKQTMTRRKRAGFPYLKTLEEFDFGFQKSISKKQMLY